MRLEVGSSVTRWCGRSVRLLLPKQPRYVTHALGYRTVATSQREKKLCQNSLNARRTYTRRRPSYFVSLHVQQRLFSVSFPLYILPPSISMPTYHARSITVRLGSLPLAETTTSDVVLKKGEVAKRQTEAAEKKLLRSFLLDEKRILFPGDPDGYELNWLGNAPFMQVQADAGVSQSSGLYRGAHRPYASEDNRLRALSLHVKLSDKAFVSGFAAVRSCHSSTTPHALRKPPSDSFRSSITHSRPCSQAMTSQVARYYQDSMRVDHLLQRTRYD